MHNLFGLTLGFFDDGLLHAFGLSEAFIEDGLAFGLKVADALFHFIQALLGFSAAGFQILEVLADTGAAAGEELAGQTAHEVPQDTGEDDEVEHTPAKVAPARRVMPFRGLRPHGEKQRKRKDRHHNSRQAQPSVFPFAQSPPP